MLDVSAERWARLNIHLVRTSYSLYFPHVIERSILILSISDSEICGTPRDNILVKECFFSVEALCDLT